jgi:hypothetical protein
MFLTLEASAYASLWLVVRLFNQVCSWKNVQSLTRGRKHCSSGVPNVSLVSRAIRELGFQNMFSNNSQIHKRDQTQFPCDAT